MNKYLNTGIKKVLEEFPSLAPILKAFDINCDTCSGNCLTKNIFEEHNLSMKDEMELKRKMSLVLSLVENNRGRSTISHGRGITVSDNHEMTQTFGETQ